MASSYYIRPAQRPVRSVEEAKRLAQDRLNEDATKKAWRTLDRLANAVSEEVDPSLRKLEARFGGAQVRRVESAAKSVRNNGWFA